MKRSYHTSAVILYQAGVLPHELQKVIPKSTLHSWKKRDLSQLIGTLQARLLEEHTELIQLLFRYEKLLAAARVLLAVFKLYEKTLLSFKNGKRRLLEQRDTLHHICTYAQDKIPAGLLARLLNTSKSFVKNSLLKQPCVHPPFRLCKRIFPGQLTSVEVHTIRKYLADVRFLHWPLSSVYYQALREDKLYCSLSTFYKYSRKTGIIRTRQPLRKDRNRKGIRASFPLEIIHMDFTLQRLQDGTRIYYHFITDNFSRKILAWSASLRPSAKVAAANLQHILTVYTISHPPVLVLSDDGSENKAQTAQVFAAFPKLLQHRIAQKDIIFSNSMAEAVNKSMKYVHLFPKDFLSAEEAFAQIQGCVEEYNNRPVKSLSGHTPNEAFLKEKIDKEWFSAQIVQAQTERIVKNRKKSCGVC